jgi:DNA-binding NarL/FixJ family response regulator
VDDDQTPDEPCSPGAALAPGPQRRRTGRGGRPNIGWWVTSDAAAFGGWRPAQPSSPEAPRQGTAPGRRRDQIRVLIADDHAPFREATRLLIEAEPDLAVLGEAEDGSEALRLTGLLHPDILLLDIGMPVRNGLEVAKEIAVTQPDTAIVLVTALEDASYVAAAVELGLGGYVTKSAPSREIIAAIRAVYSGRRYFRTGSGGPSDNPGIADVIQPREQEILTLMDQGQSNTAIAERLETSETTVLFLISSLLSKLGAQSRSDLLRLARERGLLGDV